MADNLSKFLQANSFILIILISAVSSSSVGLYRLGSLETKVDRLITTVTNVGLIEKEVKDLKSHNKEMMSIFYKFSSSVEKLSITVAKLETKVELRGRRDG